VTSFNYDQHGWLTSRMDAVGTPVQRTTTFAYDVLGRQTTITDADGHVTSYGYDAVGRVRTVTDPDGGVVTTSYDLAGEQTVVTDPLGHSTTYAYNSRGWATTVTDPLANLTTQAYDTEGNLTSTTNARGYTTTFSYDSLNRLTQTQNAAGGLATVVYDAAGNVSARVDQRGNRTTFTYDAINEMVRRTDALSHTATQAYDSAGNLTASVDAAGYATTYAYDGLDRQVSGQAADRGITTTVYDAASNVVNSIDPLGQKTTYAYDALNQQTRTTDPLGYVTTTVYDAVGNQLNLIDASANQTTFVYDAANRLTKQTDPLGNSATFAYDLAGRMTSATDRNGNRRAVSYDADNRKTGENWLVSGSTANLLTFTYDANGNTLTAANYSGMYTMTYDALDRTSAVQEPFGQALTFSYDATSNRTQVTDSQGGTTTSVYDAANRLTTREQANGLAPVRLDFTYTARDQLATMTRWADLVQIVKVGSSAYSYDSVGRTTNVVHQNSGGTNLANFTYTYDTGGRVTTQTTNGSVVTYGYDSTNQLTSDTSSSVPTYTYDGTGNRTMTGYKTGTGNQLQNDGTYTYTYDQEGNLTKKSKGASADTWTYGYDNKNHMTWAKDAATDGGSATMMATYSYDALGNRVEKDVWQGGVTTVTRFAYDDQDVWADLNASNALLTRYVRGDEVDQLFASVSSAGTVSWQLTDRLGSLRNVTNNSGVVQDTITYDGYGNIQSEPNPSAGGRYKFTGREQDTETGLQYNRARYYDPKTGRWTSQDPIGFEAGDSNLYRYANNEPTNLLDSSGEDWKYFTVGRSSYFGPRSSSENGVSAQMYYADGAASSTLIVHGGATGGSRQAGFRFGVRNYPAGLYKLEVKMVIRLRRKAKDKQVTGDAIFYLKGPFLGRDLKVSFYDIDKTGSVERTKEVSGPVVIGSTGFLDIGSYLPFVSNHFSARGRSMAYGKVEFKLTPLPFPFPPPPLGP
jgi:RHS repeat-associated protein